jgi:hypothetical protein
MRTLNRRRAAVIAGTTAWAMAAVALIYRTWTLGANDAASLITVVPGLFIAGAVIAWPTRLNIRFGAATATAALLGILLTSWYVASDACATSQFCALAIFNIMYIEFGTFGGLWAIYFILEGFRARRRQNSHPRGNTPP